MTPQEIREYLNVPAEFPLAQELIDGMATLPVPQTDDDHIRTFKAYLKCARRLDANKANNI